MAEALLDDERAKVFDLIDQLRADGVNHIVPLPQLVVCGEQSCGKSSLLEAISGIKFPVKAGTCTLFPTQVVLRRSPTESSKVSILAGDGASDEERSRCAAFKPSSTATKDLEDTIKEAKKAMGLEKSQLSRNVLVVEISGPTRPHLSLLDLPGLFLSNSNPELRKQKSMTRDLVKHYAEQKQNIILAILSANHDLEHQEILDMIQESDPLGERTIGVLTKLDLCTGPQSQETAICLARNQRYELRLGWHVIRNVDRDTYDTQVLDRDSEEAALFSQHPWCTLSRDQVGIAAMKERLSGLLCRHISAELPKLAKSIDAKLSGCDAKLMKLGQVRITKEDQQRYLLGIANRAQLLVNKAVAGNCQDENLLEPANMQLREQVRELQDSLCSSIQLYGSSVRIHCTHDADQLTDLVATATAMAKYGHKDRLLLQEPEFQSCTDHVQRVRDGLLRRHRATYMPGLTNPEVFRAILKELTSPWSRVVDAHLNLTFEVVESFVFNLFRQLTDEHTYEMLSEHILTPALNEMRVDLTTKKLEILAPYTGPVPLSWNPMLLREWGRVQQCTPEFPKGMVDGATQNDHRTAYQLVHQAYCYYRWAQFTLVDNIAALAIEHCLLSKLGTIFEVTDIPAMSEDKLACIAGEPSEAAEKRALNESMKLSLTTAQKRCHEHESRLRRRANASEKISAATESWNPPAASQQQRSTMVGTATLPTTPPPRRTNTADLGAALEKLNLRDPEQSLPAPPLTPHRSSSSSPPEPAAPPDSTGLFARRGSRHRKSSSFNTALKSRNSRGLHAFVISSDDEL